MGDRVWAMWLYNWGMPGIGVGVSTKVLLRMPIAEGVMVILIESSISINC